MQVHTFYNNLSDSTRTLIDASIGGALMKKTTDQAYGILEDMATNSNQWPRGRMIPREVVGGLDTKVLSNLVSHVAQPTKQLQRHQGAVNAIQANPWEICESYGGQHSTIEYQLGQMTIERHSMCQGLTRINNRVSMRATLIRIRTRTMAKDGGTIRTIRTMDEGTIRIVCHLPK